jgi:hypothetical protein
MKMILTMIKEILLKKADKNNPATFRAIDSQHETPDAGQVLHSATHLGMDENGKVFGEDDKPGICAVSSELLHEDMLALCCGCFRYCGSRHIKKYVPEHRMPKLIKNNPRIEDPCLGYCDRCWTGWMIWKYKLTTICLFLGRPFVSGNSDRERSRRAARRNDKLADANQRQKARHVPSSASSQACSNILPTSGI